ncbi:n-alpha-acetyltransferase 30 [Anaeramoeba ignava]|uniref:N-alpha-acetyltransferase 30 n=1 Tax=Anaeramoeba ignava TaxID=1746090 RepID=A0A9Q0LPD9_ANAIG|nr:n-alpha-acetyltransferase 30 [Anaeramoeba ignava]
MAEELIYEVYKDESQIPQLMDLFSQDLSEPYSIFTYRYFLQSWPHLCFNVISEGQIIGSVISRAQMHHEKMRGYIAMLAVSPKFRRRGIATDLVVRTIEAMKKDKCTEIVLETETKNTAALKFYEKLGFIRTKRLKRYYLSGEDAFRLKMWVKIEEKEKEKEKEKGKNN